LTSNILPLDLGDGLLLRQPSWQDAVALAAFNVRIHSDNPHDPELWLGEWTKDLLRGDHPTTRATDFTLVEDRRAAGKIVSSAVLIPQVWRYEDVPFDVGRPELIGTDEGYRRRGLVRKQMDILHQWSDERGHLAQVITGIPFFYRRFGYEMALTLGGAKIFAHDQLRELKVPREENLKVREATPADLDDLERFYARHCSFGMISRVRDEKEWLYEMHGANDSSPYKRNFHLVEVAASGEPVGYFDFASRASEEYAGVREIAAAPGHSLRAVALRAARYLRDLNPQEGASAPEARTVTFILGRQHPVYQALARELLPYREPYAWYIRVPHLSTFLETICPVLERRLAESVVAGYTGSVRLNCTYDFLQLQWERGKLDSIDCFEPQHFFDGDAFFPGRTFLQLLFGFRDIQALQDAHPDLECSREAYVLLSALFPRKPSMPLGLA
jgi:hypothetical protein